MKLVTLPITPTMKNITATPALFPVPKTTVSTCCKGEAVAINGSKTVSANKPPRNNPTGMVLYWMVSLAENTRPCISTGTFVRMIAVRLALTNGSGRFDAKAATANNATERDKLCPTSPNKNDIPQAKRSSARRRGREPESTARKGGSSPTWVVGAAHFSITYGRLRRNLTAEQEVRIQESECLFRTPTPVIASRSFSLSFDWLSAAWQSRYRQA